VPITKAVLPERVSASRCCMAPPTVTTSRTEARMPIPHSRATYSSVALRGSFVA
jgi:hypothetical protein